MSENKETRELLLESAKTEFLENGFMKASLRTICKNANVTTGALYFFFKDKNDLFASVINQPLQEIVLFIQEHMLEDESLFSNSDFLNMNISEHQKNHNDFGHKIIHHLYSNHDAFILLLTKAKGSSYENYTDKLIELLEFRYKAMLSAVSKDNTQVSVNDYLIHWLSHMTIDAFTHLLVYEKNENTAMKYIDKIMKYILQGWMDLLINND